MGRTRIEEKTSALSVAAPANWKTLGHILLMAVLPMALLGHFKPEVTQFWQWLITLWANALELSIKEHFPHIGNDFSWEVVKDGSVAPSDALLWLTLFTTVIIYITSYFFHDKYFPLKIIVRALCLIQVTAVVYFFAFPASFPYSVTSHITSLLKVGFYYMMAIAPMLAVGLGILRIPPLQRYAAIVGVLTYFSVMLPHKALLHALILESTSVLFMPILFLCFGSLVDLMIFISLYAWLVSLTPKTLTLAVTKESA
jgi:hypothetical protein